MLFVADSWPPSRFNDWFDPMSPTPRLIDLMREPHGGLLARAPADQRRLERLMADALPTSGAVAVGSGNVEIGAQDAYITKTGARPQSAGGAHPPCRTACSAYGERSRAVHPGVAEGRIIINDQDAFERILGSCYEAMLDDAHWPATSALIDEACGTCPTVAWCTSPTCTRPARSALWAPPQSSVVQYPPG